GTTCSGKRPANRSPAGTSSTSSSERPLLRDRLANTDLPAGGEVVAQADAPLEQKDHGGAEVEGHHLVSDPHRTWRIVVPLQRSRRLQVGDPRLVGPPAPLRVEGGRDPAHVVG